MKIVLLRDYLRHDIEQLVHRYSGVRFADNPEGEFNADLGGNESDEQLSLRYCITGCAELGRILRDYISNENSDADDFLEDKTKWEFKFKNELFDSQSLASLMHWFVVKWALCQWCEAFSPNDLAIAKTDLKEAKDDLSNMLLDSDMPVKEKRTLYQDTDEVEVVYGRA